MASDCMKPGLIFGQNTNRQPALPYCCQGCYCLDGKGQELRETEGGDFPTHIIIPTFAERSFLLSTPTESLKKLFHGGVFYI